MTCCFTGHRHFPWGDDTESPHWKDLLAGLENAIDWALVEGVTHFICGNAVGVDTWAAEMVLQKKKRIRKFFWKSPCPSPGTTPMSLLVNWYKDKPILCMSSASPSTGKPPFPSEINIWSTTAIF